MQSLRSQMEGICEITGIEYQMVDGTAIPTCPTGVRRLKRVVLGFADTFPQWGWPRQELSDGFDQMAVWVAMQAEKRELRNEH